MVARALLALGVLALGGAAYALWPAGADAVKVCFRRANDESGDCLRRCGRGMPARAAACESDCLRRHEAAIDGCGVE